MDVKHTLSRGSETFDDLKGWSKVHELSCVDFWSGNSSHELGLINEP